MKKLGLVLGSSGSRGASYIGFLSALEENHIKPYCIAGSSMGSVVGGAFATGMNTKEMEKELLSLNFSKLVDPTLFLIKNSAILRSKKVEKKLDEYFNGKTFNDLKIPFACVATDLVSGDVYTFKGKDNVCQGVLASCSIPSIFKPIIKEDMLLVDGGVKCRLPIRQAIDLGAEVIVAVDALGSTRRQDKSFNLLTIIARSMEIMDGEITRYRCLEFKPSLVLEPELGDMSQFKFKNMDFAIAKGYELGIKNIDSINKLLKG